MIALFLAGPRPRRRLLTKDVISKGFAIDSFSVLIKALTGIGTPPRARPPDVAYLDARLRRDIGLPDETDFPDYIRFR